MAFELFATGLYSQSDLRRKLEIAGMKKLNKNKVGHILRNKVYIGYLTYHWLEEPKRGIFEPLIDERTFYKVQAILEGKKPLITGYKRNREEFPLRQWVRCPNCNTPLTASWSKGRNNKYAYYHCHNRDCDIKFRMSKERLEEAFVEHLEEIKPDKSLIKLFRAIVEDVYSQYTKEQKELNAKLNKDLVELTERKKRLTSKYIDEKVSESDYKLFNEDLDASILSKKMHITETKIPEKDLSQCLDWCCFTFNNIQKIWEEGSLDLRQRFQKLIYPNGLTYDTEKFRTDQKSIVFNTFEAIRNNEVIYGADDGDRTHEYRYHKPRP